MNQVEPATVRSNCVVLSYVILFVSYADIKGSEVLETAVDPAQATVSVSVGEEENEVGCVIFAR